MQVQINGSVMELSSKIETVAQLMEHLELKSPIIIVEHNKIILQKEDHKTTIVEDGDAIEFVQFVGGG